MTTNGRSARRFFRSSKDRLLSSSKPVEDTHKCRQIKQAEGKQLQELGLNTLQLNTRDVSDHISKGVNF